jgi:hypothetical protein
MGIARRMHRRAFPAYVAFVLVTAVVAFGGCGDDDDSSGNGAQQVTPGVFLAQVGNSYLALVTDGQRLSGAYLCNSEKVSSWIQPAPLEGGTAKLVARRGDDLGQASFAGASAGGEVIVAGGSQSFSAELAKGKAGLFRTTSGKANQPGFSETGWIVLADGSTCGTTTTLTQGGAKIAPAPSSPKGQIKNYADPFPF